FALCLDLGVIAHPAKQIVSSARRSAGASGNFGSPGRVDLDAEQTRAPNDDLLHFIGGVIIEPRAHAKSRTQRRAYHSGTGGRADQCKFWQLQTQTACLRPLIDDDVEPIIDRKSTRLN